MAYSVYILECADETFYVGMASDLTNRVYEHKRGEVGYTKSRLPIRVAYKESFENEPDARRREVQLKAWSRAKKRAIIEGNDPQLSTLSKKKFGQA